MNAIVLTQQQLQDTARPSRHVPTTMRYDYLHGSFNGCGTNPEVRRDNRALRTKAFLSIATQTDFHHLWEGGQAVIMRPNSSTPNRPREQRHVGFRYHTHKAPCSLLTHKIKRALPSLVHEIARYVLSSLVPLSGGYTNGSQP